MPHFEARTSTAPGRIVVTLTGECDLAAQPELTTVLSAAVRAAPVVVVDVGGLRFLDSTGLHGLVTAHQAARADGRRLYAVNASGPVATVLDITGIGNLLRPPADDPRLAG
jgi:anti-sigma B factor antagonist